MACDSLLTTGLLQVVNRIVKNCFSQVVSTSCNKSANNDKLRHTCCNLMKLTSLLQLLISLWRILLCTE